MVGTSSSALSPSLKASAALAAAGSLWGTAFFFAKIAFREISVSENVALRFLFAALVLAPLLFKTRRRFSGADFGLMSLSALMGIPVQFLIQFKGLELTTVSHAALMMGTLPVILALSSVFFLHERLKPLEWTALAASVLGVFLIAAAHAHSTQGPQPRVAGDLLVLLSLFAAVFMVLVTKRLIHTYEPMYVTAWQIVTGMFMLLLWLALTQTPRIHLSAKTWAAVAAQGILATAVTFLLWNWGLARVPASRAGIFLNLEPLVGTVLGLTLLHERLGSLAIAGGALVILAAGYFSSGRTPAAKEQNGQANISMPATMPQ